MTGETPELDQAPTAHGRLIAWVREIAALTRPTFGSHLPKQLRAEHDALLDRLDAAG